MKAAIIPDCCRYCPHFDTFQSNCSHPAHQSIIHALKQEPEACPVFDSVRAEAMADLQSQLEEAN